MNDVKTSFIERSPLVDFFEKMDNGMKNAEYDDYEKMAYVLHAKDKYYGTNLFLDDVQFRANHELNVISSVAGQQGTGKSLFSICLNWNIAKIFGNPFDVEKEDRKSVV